MMRKCDHVGAAVYTSLDGSERICYRCGQPVEKPPPPDPEPDLASNEDTQFNLRDDHAVVVTQLYDNLVSSVNMAGKVGREHPETSKVAAGRIMPASGTQRSKVLIELMGVAPEGMTDEELQSELQMNPSSERPRRIELVEQGWVEDSGKCRQTSSGAEAILWRYLFRP